jgi:serine/threonine protein kinase
MICNQCKIEMSASPSGFFCVGCNINIPAHSSAPSEVTCLDTITEPVSDSSHPKVIANAEGYASGEPSLESVREISSPKSLDYGSQQRQNPQDLIDERYLLGSCLGAGGQGTVFRARDTKLELEVAVKEIALSNSNAVDVAKREMQAQVRCSYIPGIVAMEDVVATGSKLYLVMEYFPSIHLRTYAIEKLKRQPPPATVLKKIILGIAQPLSHMHKKQIYHCDLKPSNILIDQEQNIKLIDFGFSRTQSFHTTLYGKGFGTLGFSAPEQLDYSKASVSADIYGFGAVLFFLLGGGKTPAENYIEFEGVKPQAFQGPLKKAMSREPGDRYQGIMEFVEALMKALRSQSSNYSGFSPSGNHDLGSRDKITPNYADTSSPPTPKKSKNKKIQARAGIETVRDLSELSISLNSAVIECDFIQAHAEMQNLFSEYPEALIVKDLRSGELKIHGLTMIEIEHGHQDAIAATALLEVARKEMSVGDAKKALGYLDKILAVHLGNKIANDLTEGNTAIGGYTYYSLQKFVAAEIKASELLEWGKQHATEGDFAQALDSMEEILRLDEPAISKRLLNGDITLDGLTLQGLRARASDLSRFKDKLFEAEALVQSGDILGC